MKVIYLGEQFALAGGLQKLLELKTKVKAAGKPQSHVLAARFISGDLEVKNSWKFWTYPRVRPMCVPEMVLFWEDLNLNLAALK